MPIAVVRIGRTGRAGAKGIAYTLATREDAEQVASIEKLTGQKLPKAEPEAGPEAPQPESEVIEAGSKRGRGRKRSNSEAPTQAAPTRQASSVAIPLEPRMADDAKASWNGPVPSFLQFGAA